MTDSKQPHVALACPGTEGWVAAGPGVAASLEAERTLARAVFPPAEEGPGGGAGAGAGGGAGGGADASAGGGEDWKAHEPRWRLKLSCATCMLPLARNAAVFLAGPAATVGVVVAEARRVAAGIVSRAEEAAAAAEGAGAGGGAKRTNRAVGLAVGTGQELRAPPKAKRPRGVVFYRLLSAATVSRNQEAGMAIFPCAAGLCSLCRTTANIRPKDD